MAVASEGQVSIEFKFDEAAFRREVESVAQEATDHRGALLQGVLDDVVAGHRGEHADIVRAELIQVLARLGLKLGDQHIAAYAEAISNGHGITVEVQKLKLPG